MKNRFNPFITALLLFPVLIITGCSDSPTGPIAESPFVWVAGDLTVLKSSDAGDTWVDFVKSGGVPILYTDQSFRSISFSSTHHGCISGNNAYRSTMSNSISFVNPMADYSTRVYQASVMVDSNAYYYLNSGVVNRVIGDQDKSLLFQYAPGLRIYISNNPTLYSLDFINVSTGWVVGNNSTVLFTTDSGYTWRRQITEPKQTHRAIQIFRNSASERSVWIAGDNGAVYKTTNMGTTWVKCITGTTANLTALCIADDNVAYFAGPGGVILKSSDNGASFITLNSGTEADLNSISFVDANTGFAVGANGTLLRTTDGGATWTQLSWGCSADLYSVCCVKRFRNK